MRRHFLALEAFDNTSTGAPTDAETDKPATAPTPEAEPAPAPGPAADPAAAESTPPTDAPVPAESTGAGRNPEPSEPDEAKPLNPEEAPALPAEPGVEPQPVSQDGPTPAEPSAEPAPAVPSEPTNASTATEPTEGAAPTETPETAASTEPTETPTAPTEEPPALPDDTPPADDAVASSSAETPVGGADDQPTPAGGAPEADSEAMEALRDQVELRTAMEEIAQELAEGGETAAEINHDLAESERVIQVSDALEDLAFVASTIEAATPAEAALMETAGNLAVAGTDVEPDVIVPAMESYIGGRIATEGIKETAKRIWQSIVQFVTRIWEKIRAFWRNKVTIPNLKKAIEKVEKGLANYKEPAHGTKVKVTRACMELADHHQDNVLAKLTALFEEQPTHVESRGSAVLAALKDFDPKDPSKSIEKLIAHLKTVAVGGPGGAHIITHLAGGYRLEYQSLQEVDASALPAVQLERIRNTGYRFVKGDAAGKSITGTEEVAALGHARLQEFVKNVRRLIEALEKFYGTHFDKLDKKGQEIKAASAELTKKIEQPEGESGSAMTDYRALVNFNKTFAEWAYQPFVPAFGYAVKLISAGIRGVEGHLSLKTEKKEAEGKKD